MKSLKNRHPVRRILLILLAVLIVTGIIFSHFGGFGTGSSADTEEFAKYAKTVPDIEIPAEARIIALGEATHGNVEFQQLKLDVLKVLVEKYGVRSFALEGDYGGCEVVNRYIHGGEGTARRAAEAIGFAIYRTEQMEQLITWMHDYNKNASDKDQLCFYGFDMQRYENSYKFLLEAMEESDLDTSGLKSLWNEEKNEYSETSDADQRVSVFENVKKEFQDHDGPDIAQAVHLADVLIQNCEYGKVIDAAGTSSVVRDKFMADNVDWILEQEEARGNKQIFISAHDGHIAKSGSYGSEGKVMGNLLADEYGNGYYAIGTDFYKASVNLPKGDGKRIRHSFYSHDSLAKASKKCGFEISWLDFAAIPADSPLKQQTKDFTWMASLGEYYSSVMAVVPLAYRIRRPPAELYDSMIFVTNGHPTEILEPTAE